MANKTVQFGLTSKGKQSVLHKQYEFVKHREYANGTIQWRCKLYQKSRCQARMTTEGWHFGLQALFQCHHPTLWTFIQGIEKDLQMQRAAFLQGIAGTQPSIPKRYKELKLRVQNTVDRYLSSEILVYLRAIAHISHA